MPPIIFEAEAERELQNRLDAELEAIERRSGGPIRSAAFVAVPWRAPVILLSAADGAVYALNGSRSGFGTKRDKHISREWVTRLCNRRGVESPLVVERDASSGGGTVGEICERLQGDLEALCKALGRAALEKLVVSGDEEGGVLTWVVSLHWGAAPGADFEGGAGAGVALFCSAVSGEGRFDFYSELVAGVRAAGRPRRIAVESSSVAHVRELSRREAELSRRRAEPSSREAEARGAASFEPAGRPSVKGGPAPAPPVGARGGEVGGRERRGSARRFRLSYALKGVALAYGVLVILPMAALIVAAMMFSIWTGMSKARIEVAFWSSRRSDGTYERAFPAINPGAAVSRTRLLGPVRSHRAGTMPLCLVAHEARGADGAWREDERRVSGDGGKMTTPSGKVVTLSVKRVRFERPLLEVDSAEREAALRKELPGLAEGGRLLAGCVEDGETVFVEGCLADRLFSASELGPCGDEPVRVVTGERLPRHWFETGERPPQHLLDALAARDVGVLALFAEGVLALSAFALVRLRSSSVAHTLKAITPVNSRSKSDWVGWFFALVVVFVTLIWLNRGGLDGRGAHFSYAIASAALAFGGALAHACLAHYRALRAAAVTVSSAPTVPLTDADGARVELSVRVDAESPRVAGPLSRKLRAYARIEVREEYKIGKTSHSNLVLDRAEPSGLLIRDASGGGALELAHARVFTRVLSAKFSGADLPRSLHEVVGNVVSDRTYVFKEHYLDAGEPLYVLGPVRRVADPGRSVGYREAATRPIVGGDEAAPLLVCAGTERALLRKAALVQAGLGALGASVAALVVALGAAVVFLASR